MYHTLISEGLEFGPFSGETNSFRMPCHAVLSIQKSTTCVDLFSEGISIRTNDGNHFFPSPHDGSMGLGLCEYIIGWLFMVNWREIPYLIIHGSYGFRKQQVNLVGVNRPPTLLLICLPKRCRENGDPSCSFTLVAIRAKPSEGSCQFHGPGIFHVVRQSLRTKNNILYIYPNLPSV